MPRGGSGLSLSISHRCVLPQPNEQLLFILGDFSKNVLLQAFEPKPFPASLFIKPSRRKRIENRQRFETDGVLYGWNNLIDKLLLIYSLNFQTHFLSQKYFLPRNSCRDTGGLGLSTHLLYIKMDFLLHLNISEISSLCLDYFNQLNVIISHMSVLIGYIHQPYS